LGAFCEVLGLRVHVDVVVASAEVGAEKPDGRIFAEACRQLSLVPEQMLHVGDTEADDVAGARAAGLHALWLRREMDGAPSRGEIRSLEDIPAYLAVSR
jgi:putative hydrolase of the HAD superfamily